MVFHQLFSQKKLNFRYIQNISFGEKLPTLNPVAEIVIWVKIEFHCG